MFIRYLIIQFMNKKGTKKEREHIVYLSERLLQGRVADNNSPRLMDILSSW